MPGSARFTSRPPLPRTLLLVPGLALALGASPVAAQFLVSGPLREPLAPAGRLRVSFDPLFASWHTRYREAEGSSAVVKEPLARDLTDPTGARPFPGVALVQEHLAALTGSSLPTPVIGDVRGELTQNVRRVELRADVGVFSWLTVGAMVPWSRNRTALDVAFFPAPDATWGVNPAITDNEAVSTYLQAVGDAASLAADRAAGACATDPASAACSAAERLAQRAGDFAARSQVMYFLAPFFPLAGTTPADALTAAAVALEDDLVAAGIGAIGAPAFATRTADAEEFTTLTTDPAAGIQGSPLKSRKGLWEMGDAEFTAAARILRGSVVDSGAAHPRLAWDLQGGVLVRLGTGVPPSPDVFFDLGSGDGQTDVEGFVYGAFRAGSRMGLRAVARYGIQRGAALLRRVTAPDAPLAPLNSRRAVYWTPGKYLDLSLSPRIVLGDALALAVDYRRFRKNADRFSLLNPAGDGSDPDVSVLARETGLHATQIAIGLRYSTLDAWRAGKVGSPMDLSLRLVRTVAGSGGRTPADMRVEAGVSLFRRIWGS
ncbi:MAG: hypothetical protein ACE5GJ_00425 [Gemmatimonadota bacterium]